MEITKKYKGYTLKVVMTEAKRGYRYDIYLNGENEGALCGKGYTPNYMFQILEGLVDILVNAGICAGKFRGEKNEN